MPLYEYKCESHGAFEVILTLSERDGVVCCPVCSSESRKLITAPALRNMAPSMMNAHERNERSRQAPHVCSSGCGHNHKPKKQHNNSENKKPKIRQLEAFQIFSKTLSFAETARQMGVTPSAISHSIKSLELHLDSELVDRKARPMKLTPVGNRFVSRSKVALDMLENALEDVASEDSLELPDSVVHIGIERALASHLMLNLITQLKLASKKTKFEIYTNKTSVLLDKLKAAEIDLVAGLTPPAKHLKGISYHEVFHTEGLKLITLNDEKHREIMDDFDWSKENGIISLCYDDYDKELIESYFYQLQTEIDIHHHVDSQTAFVELIKAGMGVGIGSESMLASKIQSKELLCHPLPGGDLNRNWSLYSMTNQPSKKLAKLFKSLLVSSE